MPDLFSTYDYPHFTEEETEVKLSAPLYDGRHGAWGFPEASWSLKQRYFCCLYFVSRLEVRGETEGGARDGDRGQPAPRLLTECRGPGCGRRGGAACGAGRLEAPGAVLRWPPHQNSCGSTLRSLGKAGAGGAWGWGRGEGSQRLFSGKQSSAGPHQLHPGHIPPGSTTTFYNSQRVLPRPPAPWEV